MITTKSPGIEWRQLGDRHGLWTGKLPSELRLAAQVFDELWNLIARGLEPTQPLRPPDPVIEVKGVVCFRDPDGHIVELIEYFGDRLGSRTYGLRTKT